MGQLKSLYTRLGPRTLEPNKYSLRVIKSGNTAWDRCFKHSNLSSTPHDLSLVDVLRGLRRRGYDRYYKPRVG